MPFEEVVVVAGGAVVEEEEEEVVVALVVVEGDEGGRSASMQYDRFTRKLPQSAVIEGFCLDQSAQSSSKTILGNVPNT
jgi:hypothetical protein